MTKIEFEFHLAGASFLAYKFAQNYVSNCLSTDFEYNVILNVSTDDPKLEQFDIYPEDNGMEIVNLSEKEVVELLFRSGNVPVWIDINVLKSNKQKTTLKLQCAGRYSGDKNEFYYNHNGSGPFGVKSPILPLGYVEGKKFKLKK